MLFPHGASLRRSATCAPLVHPRIALPRSHHLLPDWSTRHTHIHRPMVVLYKCYVLEHGALHTRKHVLEGSNPFPTHSTKSTERTEDGLSNTTYPQKHQTPPLPFAPPPFGGRRGPPTALRVCYPPPRLGVKRPAGGRPHLFRSPTRAHALLREGCGAVGGAQRPPVDVGSGCAEPYAL